ncbi:hypothetical protein, partial [Nocardia araoensis]|uniref:hypothetical protein n=1 Tax=Nocardia araoensis TaxID=228600 RepID=UPI001C3F3749
RDRAESGEVGRGRPPEDRDRAAGSARGRVAAVAVRVAAAGRRAVAAGPCADRAAAAVLPEDD